jgi:hypothetical protein
MYSSDEMLVEVDLSEAAGFHASGHLIMMISHES